jgi:hypothetical protein
MIRNAFGFSMPEILVALGLMGGISLVTMKIVEDQKGNEAFIRGNAEIEKTISLLKTTLNDPENCRSILAGSTLNATGTALGSLRIPLKTSPGQFKEILAANRKYSDFETQGISLAVPAGSPPSTAEVQINFRIRSRNLSLWGASTSTGPGDRIISKTIPVIVSQTGTTLTDCGPVVSDTNATAKQKFCESLGGATTWNAPTQTCSYNDMTCPFGQVLVRLTSMGGAICEDIKNHIKLDDLFDTSPCVSTGKFRIIDNGSGKLRIDCAP